MQKSSFFGYCLRVNWLLIWLITRKVKKTQKHIIKKRFWGNLSRNLKWKLNFKMAEQKLLFSLSLAFISTTCVLYSRQVKRKKWKNEKTKNKYHLANLTLPTLVKIVGAALNNRHTKIIYKHKLHGNDIKKFFTSIAAANNTQRDRYFVADAAEI